MIKRIDENTGREVRQLTDLPAGVRLPYFRRPRHTADGRLIGLFAGEYKSIPVGHKGIALIDPESGDVEILADTPGAYITMLEDGRAIFSTADEKREVYCMALPDGQPELIGSIPEHAPGDTRSPGIFHNVTCDGRTVILAKTDLLLPADPVRDSDTEDDAGVFWRHIYRPRSGTMYAYDLQNDSLSEVVHLDRYSFQHIDPSPCDPTLIKYAQDGLGLFDQRIWTVRIDGSEYKPIRRQQKGEWVHHEFWWPGGQHIGYEYVDRRNDFTCHELPWGELAPRPLQLGIADLTGREVYLSDPLCCFQSHLFVSPKGDMISGEGTLNNSFVYAAPFSWDDYKIDLQPLATIHTPYLLSAAQSVESGFTLDSKWVVYNDKVDGKLQVHAVKV